jgi:hypothetical protein
MRTWIRIAALGLILMGSCLSRPATPRPSLISVIVLMEGVGGDRGPFDFAAAGVAAFQRSEGVSVPLIAMGYDPLSWERMIREAVRDPNHRLFLIGMEGPARLGLEMARIFPGKRFVLLGLPPEEAIPPNVLAISFDEWEMGWVAGYIAGRWADPARTRQPIGALIGPGAEALWEGYACGARAAGTPPEALQVEIVASDRDPIAGFEAALRLYAQRVPIAAGLAGGAAPASSRRRAPCGDTPSASARTGMTGMRPCAPRRWRPCSAPSPRRSMRSCGGRCVRASAGSSPSGSIGPWGGRRAGSPGEGARSSSIEPPGSSSKPCGSAPCSQPRARRPKKVAAKAVPTR